jgi:hypothetical protein
MASMNYFNSNRKNPTYVLKWKSVMERHVITKSTSIHDYSCFCYGCHRWSGNCLSSRSTCVHSRFWWSSCCSISDFLYNVLQMVICPFSFAHCAVCSSSIYRFCPRIDMPPHLDTLFRFVRKWKTTQYSNFCIPNIKIKLLVIEQL